jgi:hypothetical protein
MAYKFKLVHGSTERNLSEHEAKYRIEKQGVAITGAPAGDDCEHCAEGALHIHASDDREASDPPPLPPAEDPSLEKGEQLQATAGSAADGQVAAAELPLLTGERIEPDTQPESAIVEPEKVAETPAVEASAPSSAPTEAPAPPASSSSSGRQSRRGR